MRSRAAIVFFRMAPRDPDASHDTILPAHPLLPRLIIFQRNSVHAYLRLSM